MSCLRRFSSVSLVGAVDANVSPRSDATFAAGLVRAQPTSEPLALARFPERVERSSDPPL